MYTRQQRIRFRNADCENGGTIVSTIVSTNVYSCALPSPGPAVQPGDILGIYQPKPRNGRYIMYVDRRPGGTFPQSYVSTPPRSPFLINISRATTQYVHPLVAVEIGKPCTEKC